jgi:tetratricopeptide (TPR) repeat protein
MAAMKFPRAAFGAMLFCALVFGAAGARRSFAADGDHPVSAPTGASGSDVEEAKARFAAGRALYEKGEYVKALAEFQAGFALTRVPAFLINSGLCHKKLGDKTAAREDFRSFLQMEPNSPRKAEVEKLIAELGPAEDATKKPAAEAPPSDDPAAADLLLRQRAAAQAAAPARATAPAPTRPSVPSVAMAAPAEADDEGAPLISSSGSRKGAAPMATATVKRRAEPVDDESDEERADKPLYRKAWFWGAVGVAVLAGVAGAFLATRSTTESGTLGTIDVRGR